MRKMTNFRSKASSQRKFIIAGSLSSSLCSVLLLLLEIHGSTAATDESVISLSQQKYHINIYLKMDSQNFTK
jgi:hypothetical protein